MYLHNCKSLHISHEREHCNPHHIVLEAKPFHHCHIQKMIINHCIYANAKMAEVKYAMGSLQIYGCVVFVNLHN